MIFSLMPPVGGIKVAIIIKREYLKELALNYLFSPSDLNIHSINTSAAFLSFL